MSKLPSLKLGLYRHYKGDLYRVLGVARHSETHEFLVVYQGQYDHPEFGKNPIWVRPFEMFVADVDLKGKKVKRFSFVE